MDGAKKFGEWNVAILARIECEMCIIALHSCISVMDNVKINE